MEKRGEKRVHDTLEAFRKGKFKEGGLVLALMKKRKKFLLLCKTLKKLRTGWRVSRALCLQSSAVLFKKLIDSSLCECCHGKDFSKSIKANTLNLFFRFAKERQLGHSPGQLWLEKVWGRSVIVEYLVSG